MKKLVAIPVGVLRTMRSFVSPPRDVGRVPLGRFLIVLQLIAALVFLGYTLAKKSVRLPFSTSAYEIEVEFADAKGLDRVDEPGAAVAGSLEGRVTEVRYEDGKAVATLTLDPDMRGKIFADASAELRPASAIQNLIVNVDPGTPSRGALPDGTPIPVGRTSEFVAIDDLTGIFDTDTRAYAQILIGEAERALRGRGDDLNAELQQVADLTDTATPIARSLATRRRLLARFVDELNVLSSTLADRSQQLGNAVSAGSDTLAVTADRETELAEATRDLTPALEEAGRALTATADLAEILNPALDRLLPVAGGLADATTKLRALLPQTGSLVDQFSELTKVGAEPSDLLLQGSEGLTAKIHGLTPTARDLVSLARILDKYRNGFAQLGDTLSAATSVNDRGGAYGQVDVLGYADPRPENLGLPGSAAKSANGAPSMLERKLALALEETCKTNPMACIMRFEIPGLPPQPVTGGGGG
jgi:phospholipid/cholesterol/gamma-HCH transport system substrate-binding protein